MESPAPLPRIHWLIALIPLATLIALQVVVIREFGSDALEGPSQTALLFAAAVAVAMGMIFYKVPWSSIDSAIGQNIKTIGPAILILFFIGAVSGSWMMSGVVPTMIYYGMQIVSPSVFLFVACLISALVSLVTGSSWTTVATIGLALMGIGKAHHFGFLFRGQDFPALRYHRAGLVGGRSAALQAHPLHAHHHRSLVYHCLDNILGGKPLPHNRQRPADWTLCRWPAARVCHQSLAADCAGGHRRAHRAAHACRHRAVPFRPHGRSYDAHRPAGHRGPNR